MGQGTYFVTVVVQVAGAKDQGQALTIVEQRITDRRDEIATYIVETKNIRRMD